MKNPPNLRLEIRRISFWPFSYSPVFWRRSPLSGLPQNRGMPRGAFRHDDAFSFAGAKPLKSKNYNETSKNYEFRAGARYDKLSLRQRRASGVPRKGCGAAPEFPPAGRRGDAAKSCEGTEARGTAEGKEKRRKPPERIKETIT
jgi:hypothetical protein